MHLGPDELDISIRSNRDVHLVVFLLLAFALNFWFLISALRSEDLFTFVWLPVCYFIGRAILWTVAGCEKISFRAQTTTLRFEMPGVGRVLSFDLAKVDAFRIFKRPAVQRLGLFMMYPDHRGRIVFDYNGKVHAFGVDLSQTEAERVIQCIRQYESASSATNAVAQASI